VEAQVSELFTSERRLSQSERRGVPHVSAESCILNEGNEAGFLCRSCEPLPCTSTSSSTDVRNFSESSRPTFLLHSVPRLILPHTTQCSKKQHMAHDTPVGGSASKSGIPHHILVSQLLEVCSSVSKKKKNSAVRAYEAFFVQLVRLRRGDSYVDSFKSVPNIWLEGDESWIASGHKARSYQQGWVCEVQQGMWRRGTSHGQIAKCKRSFWQFWKGKQSFLILCKNQIEIVFWATAHFGFLLLLFTGESPQAAANANT
jgi:hypothetical protein